MQLPQHHKPPRNEKSIGAFEARRKFGQLIEEAYYHKDAFVVERAGRPMAVIVSVDEYRKLKQNARHEVMDMIREVWERTAHIPQEELEKDVEKAMEMLHQERASEVKQSKTNL
jgi:prevent-host-death family protein